MNVFRMDLKYRLAFLHLVFMAVINLSLCCEEVGNLCSICGCNCTIGLSCENGPPQNNDDSVKILDEDIHFYLNGEGNDNQLMYLNLAWTTNLTLTDDSGEVWDELDIRAGKYNFTTRELTYPNLTYTVEIRGLKNLVSISTDAFQTLSRGLRGLFVLQCPSLISIEAAQDYPHLPLRMFSYLYLHDLESLSKVDFLNSPLQNGMVPYEPVDDSFVIHLDNLPALNDLGLRRPLVIGNSTRGVVRFHHLPRLSTGMSMCFMRKFLERATEIEICNTSCSSCELVWLQAWSSSGPPKSTNFGNLPTGYDLPKNPNVLYEAIQCVTESCSNLGGNYSIWDWPVSFEVPTYNGYEQSIEMHCPTFKWDPFYVYHECFIAGNVWTSCLVGCDCNSQYIRCKESHFYDKKQKRILITGEDFPNLLIADERSFENAPSDLEIETFYVYRNDKLMTLMPEMSKFDGKFVKNIIVSRNPNLMRMDGFVSPSFVNLEYLELSYLGDSFSQTSALILTEVFSVKRPALVVLDLSFSKISVIPRLDFPGMAPSLRYLILKGNQITHLDMEALYPFYILPSEARYQPPMMTSRMSPTTGGYGYQKTLDLRFNPLVCDCSMSLEHLYRVQSSKSWNENQLTYVSVDDICKQGVASESCETTTLEDGCVFVRYAKDAQSMDLNCYMQPQQYTLNNGYSPRINYDQRSSGQICNSTGSKLQFCSFRELATKDYPYFYCDEFYSVCRPAWSNDPLLPDIPCDPSRTGFNDDCYTYQNLDLECDRRNAEGNCLTQIWECNGHLGVCQFKYPYKRSSFKVSVCKAQIGRYIGRGFWNPNDLDFAKKAWKGDCGFHCKDKPACLWLESKFPGFRFCCTKEGFCSTNCFNNCPAGLTGELCETDLSVRPLRCPVGWGGDQCSVKLCNKFFLCANGGYCDKGDCVCTSNFFGPECNTPAVCLNNPCKDYNRTYCLSTNGVSTSCMNVSTVFAKYKYLSEEDSAPAIITGKCDPQKCSKLMEGAACMGTVCGCPIGHVIVRKPGMSAICIPGAQPCSTSGDCSTIHPEMVCSGNPAYIEKATVRPIGYVSFCLCSMPAFFHTTTGACLKEANETADTEFLKVGDLSEEMSGAVIAIIVLAVIGAGVGVGSFFLLRKKKTEDTHVLKKQASKTNKLANTLAARGANNNDTSPASPPPSSPPAPAGLPPSGTQPSV